MIKKNKSSDLQYFSFLFQIRISAHFYRWAVIRGGRLLNFFLLRGGGALIRGGGA